MSVILSCLTFEGECSSKNIWQRHEWSLHPPSKTMFRNFDQNIFVINSVRWHELAKARTHEDLWVTFGLPKILNFCLNIEFLCMLFASQSAIKLFWNFSWNTTWQRKCYTLKNLSEHYANCRKCVWRELMWMSKVCGAMASKYSKIKSRNQTITASFERVPRRQKDKPLKLGAQS